jgi:hypothetical protein
MLGGVGGAPEQSGPLSRCTPDMGVNLRGASPLDENGNLKETSIPNVTPIDRSPRRRQLRGGDEPWGGSRSQSCEATYRNAIKAKRDPEASCRWTTKPFPTDPTVDGELVQRKFTRLFGEICARTRE